MFMFMFMFRGGERDLDYYKTWFIGHNSGNNVL